MDALNAGAAPAGIGTRTILGPSFQGGNRHM